MLLKNCSEILIGDIKISTNPYFTQYHTQRFSFIGSPQQRDGTYLKDQRFVNLYPELIKSPISDGKKYYLKKRPGFSLANTVAPGTGRGIYFWASQGLYFYAVGNTLYRNGIGFITMTTTTGPVGFAEYRDDTSGDSLFFCDGVNGWVIGPGPTGGSVLITDSHFPNPHVPNPIFLDGYIFLAATGTQTVHNSQLQNPYVWPADGFIDAEMFPDSIVGLAKVQNYLACIGTQSIEWLYDNANATGSPLQRNAPAVSQLGCPAPQSIVQTEKELILVGQTGNGGRTVWVINGFQPTEIANEPIRQALDTELDSINGAVATTVQSAGHKWYVLTLSGGQRTFVYDFDEQMWHEWTDGTGQTAIPWHYSTDTPYGFSLWLHYNSGQTANFGETTYSDVSGPINCMAITTKIDFDTIKRKRLYRLSLVGDAPNGDNTVPITVQWSDDDYNTWSSAYTLNINATYPTITQLGYTRRRAFKFTFQQPYPLRLEAFEVDLVQEVRR